MGIGCSLERAKIVLVVVASIDERHIRIGNQIIPVLRINKLPYLVVGIHIGPGLV